MIIIIFQSLVIAYVLSDLSIFVSEFIVDLAELVNNKWIKLGLYSLAVPLSCRKCFTFWTVLVLGESLFIAAFVALLMEFLSYDKIR